jgi:hypothetical protein
MGSHHEEPPVQVEGAPDEEGLADATVDEDLEREPDEKRNYTERHPEHFRNPPGHVSEIRDEPSEPED